MLSENKKVAAKPMQTHDILTPHILTHDGANYYTSRRTHLLQVSLADAQVREFSHYLRDHLIMESVAVARSLNLEFHTCIYLSQT